MAVLLILTNKILINTNKKASKDCSLDANYMFRILEDSLNIKLLYWLMWKLSSLKTCTTRDKAKTTLQADFSSQGKSGGFSLCQTQPAKIFLAVFRRNYSKDYYGGKVLPVVPVYISRFKSCKSNTSLPCFYLSV